MNKYLKTKEGSLEDLAKQMQNKVLESDYQDKFKKELDKAGKPIGQMTGAEKKSFFNKIDKMHSAKNEQAKNPYAIGMAAAMKAKDDKPPLKKSTITKAHDIAKSIEKDQKEEVEEQKDRDIQAVPKYSKKGGFYYWDRPVKYNSIKKFYYHPSGAKPYPPGRYTKQEEVSKKDVDKFHTSLDKLVHKSFGHSSDEKKKEEESIKEASYPHKMYSKDGEEVEAKTPEDHKKYAEMGYTHKNETHSFMTNDMNKSKKDAKGEKEIVDPAPKMKFKEAYKKTKKEAMNTVGDATADQANQRAGEGPKENDPDIKKPKAKADTGSKATPIDTSPEVEYKN